eukprot:CAMPEP_0116913800 /NCGR_PEP_ID=MMETSP0467-20121206/16925_1 /TAXON_ID=283647 /ORGANISM="Mesodinium pulex, Strain SPMC105" /LENGTH=185 /DNA_ID=CAMNT_0004590095 /DNA_START=241 /DNA_END=798 /DNA_ORIENTATION=+
MVVVKILETQDVERVFTVEFDHVEGVVQSAQQTLAAAEVDLAGGDVGVDLHDPVEAELVDHLRLPPALFDFTIDHLVQLLVLLERAHLVHPYVCKHQTLQTHLRYIDARLVVLLLRLLLHMSFSLQPAFLPREPGPQRPEVPTERQHREVLQEHLECVEVDSGFERVVQLVDGLLVEELVVPLVG